MRRISDILGARRERGPDETAVGIAGTRSEALHRLQIGLSGLAAIVLMLALASVIMDRANRTEAASVPDAAATVLPPPVHSQQNDPLADAGVVPEVKDSPTPTPTAIEVPTIALDPDDAPDPE
ncbi:hypothetical protein [Pelagerythrobacter rhizovicinus]|uniref:Uncharacterized protein n=1 Tax=Pelagerythrobacter rhizovicinus TaxID=2268576 RepID=A0A4Q2KG76_9SPHN|nr:hypothetical protein [Pelagerythrobacter rhizovicinus]RXZ64044.1 hypothetical protein ETX26_08900 [Pelagerythrobacter rhizovicinus]